MGERATTKTRGYYAGMTYRIILIERGNGGRNDPAKYMWQVQHCHTVCRVTGQPTFGARWQPIASRTCQSMDEAAEYLQTIGQKGNVAQG